MRAEQGDRQGDRRGRSREAAGGPLGELDSLRCRAREREEEVRRSVCEAALAAAGEVGYRRLSVDLIVSRAGVSRARFYRLFADKEECFAEAHRRAAERLVDEVLGDLEGAPEGCGGARRALGRPAALIESRPLLARGLLAESRLAGGGVSARREEVSERLTRAIRGARRETKKSRHSPPPFAAPFILAAIDEALLEATAREGPIPLADQLDALIELVGRACGERGGRRG